MITGVLPIAYSGTSAAAYRQEIRQPCSVRLSILADRGVHEHRQNDRASDSPTGSA